MPAQNKIKGFIFDVDGTLLDSMPMWKELPVNFAKAHGVFLDAETKKKFLTCSMEEGYVLFEKAGISMNREEMEKALISFALEQYRTAIQAKAGAAEVLSSLAENHQITCATTSTKEMVEAGLSRNHLLQYVSFIAAADEYHTSKETPVLFDACAARMSLQKEECVVVEDTLPALLTAGKYGYHTIGIYDPASASDQDQIRKNADMYVLSLLEILNQFRKRG